MSLLAVLNTAHADGPRLGKDGLYADGQVVLLKLTKEQKKFLSEGHASAVESAMKLTPAQSNMIKAQAKVETTLLEVWDTRRGQSDCSCLSTNIALRFSENFIEVLVPYLKADEQAIAKWKSVDAIQ